MLSHVCSLSWFSMISPDEINKIAALISEDPDKVEEKKEEPKSITVMPCEDCQRLLEKHGIDLTSKSSSKET